MSDRTTEMSHAQAGEMLDLLMSHGDSVADLDSKALINLAEAAQVLGRQEDADRLMGMVSEVDDSDSWAGLAKAKMMLRRGDDLTLESIESVIESAHDDDDLPLLAAAVNLRSQAEADAGDLVKAVESQSESLAVKKSLGDLIGQANGHHNLLQLAKQMDDLEVALSHAERLLELVQGFGDTIWEMSVLADLAHLKACAGDFEAADSLYRQSLDLADAAADMTGIVVSNWGLADLHLIQGNGQEAMTHYSQALAAHMQNDIPAPPALLQRIEALTGDAEAPEEPTV